MGCIGPLAGEDGAFYDWDSRRVHCALGIDSITGVDATSLDSGLDRARDREEMLEVYAHDPGRTVAFDTLEHVLAGARERGLRFVTYADVARGTERGPAIALSFDDHWTVGWLEARELFLRYDARVTFFISRYAALSETQRSQIRELWLDGHAIEAHSVDHLRAPRYVEEHGLGAYLENEALPSIELLRTDGYDVTSYAYPYGARTDELDQALLKRVSLLRSVSFTFSAATSPCPH